MFYSHDILTSRKYGVATVWLVATLGSRSTSKKVNKKAILDVDIPKACGVIIQPEAPMALRLQSNLLCGVTRVFSQQCGYALVDAQNIQAQMRQLIRTMQRGDQDLDLEVGRSARPDQLILADDPNFLPDLTLDVDFDLANLNFDTEASSQSIGVLSPESRRSSQTSHGDIPELYVPTSSGGVGGVRGLGGFDLNDISSGVPEAFRGHAWRTHDQFDAADEEILPEAEFAFDQDGNILEFDEPSLMVRSSVLDPPVRSKEANGASKSPKLRGDIIQTQQDEAEVEVRELQSMDLDVNVADKDVITAQAEPHPSRMATQDVPIDSSEEADDEGSAYGAQATMARKSRKARPLPLDKTLEIRNTELLSWSANYLVSMAEVRKKKEAAKAIFQSRKNAEWFVWGAGLGGIGYEIHGMPGMKHPLDIFCGQNLKQLLMGSETAGRKRDRVAGSDDESESRRVRQRSQEYGRGGNDETDLHAEGVDNDEPLEIGRRALTPVQGIPSTEVSSAMPWNRYGPFRSSSIGHGLGLRLRNTSRASAAPSAGELRQRALGSRLTSASPLVGRGHSRSHTHSRQRSIQMSAGLPSGAGFSSSIQGGALGLGPHRSDGLLGSDDIDVRALDDGRGASDTENELDLFGAAAAVDTQTAGGSQWLRGQLDTESGNFLEFVAAAASERGEFASADGDGDDADPFIVDTKTSKRGIVFETLLRPEENTHVVAAQGLLHVLTLATKGLMWVDQDENVFGGELRIGVTDNGAESVTAQAKDAGTGEDVEDLADHLEQG